MPLVFSELGAFAVANEDHARAEELAKGDPIVLNNRAMSCYFEFNQVPGKLQGCLVIADRSVTANPKEAAAHHTRGMINEALKRTVDARRDHAEALKLAPILVIAAEALKRLGSVTVPPVKKGAPPE